MSYCLLQDGSLHQLQQVQAELHRQRQQSALVHSTLRTIARVMPATPAQHDRWQTEVTQFHESECEAFEPQEVLQQVQCFVQQVERQHDR